MRPNSWLLFVQPWIAAFVFGQQYAGQNIPNFLPATTGAEVAFFNIDSGNGTNTTLINYYSAPSGSRPDPLEIQRLVVINHGSVRDAWNYWAAVYGGFTNATLINSEVSENNVAILSPLWANTDDITAGWPLDNRTFETNALIWSGLDWSSGSNNVLPESRQNVSTFEVLDQILQYFDRKDIYPNLHQIVVAGHSRGAQMDLRYAAVGRPLNLKTPVTYWVGNPNSFLWFNDQRPLDIGDCTIYNNWPSGLANYTNSYEHDFVTNSPQAVLGRYQSRDVALARGLNDHGDLSDDCSPYSTGPDRGERMYNFIRAFPPDEGDMVDYNDAVGHDSEHMIGMTGGVHRVFLDNFNGNGSRYADYGPRQVDGDDPHPLDTGFA